MSTTRKRIRITKLNDNQYAAFIGRGNAASGLRFNAAVFYTHREALEFIVKHVSPGEAVEAITSVAELDNGESCGFVGEF